MAKKRSIAELSIKSDVTLSNACEVAYKVAHENEDLHKLVESLCKELQESRKLFDTLTSPIFKRVIIDHNVSGVLSKLFPEANQGDVSNTIERVLADILGKFLETVPKEKCDRWAKLFKENYHYVCLLKLEMAYFFKAKKIFNTMWESFPIIVPELRLHRSLNCALTEIFYNKAAYLNQSYKLSASLAEAAMSGVLRLDDYNYLMNKNFAFSTHLNRHHSEEKEIPVGSTEILSLKIDPLMLFIRNTVKLISLNYDLPQVETITFATVIYERYESKISPESMKNKLILFEKQHEKVLETIFFKRYSQLSKEKNQYGHCFPLLFKYLQKQ